MLLHSEVRTILYTHERVNVRLFSNRNWSIETYQVNSYAMFALLGKLYCATFRTSLPLVSRDAQNSDSPCGKNCQRQDHLAQSYCNVCVDAVT